MTPLLNSHYVAKLKSEIAEIKQENMAYRDERSHSLDEMRAHKNRELRLLQICDELMRLSRREPETL